VHGVYQTGKNKEEKKGVGCMWLNKERKNLIE
jgi:hypothetical protein